MKDKNIIRITWPVVAKAIGYNVYSKTSGAPWGTQTLKKHHFLTQLFGVWKILDTRNKPKPKNVIWKISVKGKEEKCIKHF